MCWRRSIIQTSRLSTESSRVPSYGTRRRRGSRRPRLIDLAIDYARQIAAGLEAAHDRASSIRDLKPANIKVTPEGIVKLLIRARQSHRPECPPPPRRPTMSPTLSLEMTHRQMILEHRRLHVTGTGVRQAVR